ncbi:hypothetical protein GCM10009551_013460 [Nocardiopsis tropica]
MLVPEMMRVTMAPVNGRMTRARNVFVAVRVYLPLPAAFFAERCSGRRCPSKAGLYGNPPRALGCRREST